MEVARASGVSSIFPLPVFLGMVREGVFEIPHALAMNPHPSPAPEYRERE